MNTIRVAVLDMYNNFPNEGMRCIRQLLRRAETDYALRQLPVLLDVKYLMSLYIRQQNEEEKQRRSDFFRDYEERGNYYKKLVYQL